MKKTTSVYLHLQPTDWQYIGSKGDYGYTNFDVVKMTKQGPTRGTVKAGTVAVKVNLSLDPSIFNNLVNVDIELAEGYLQPHVEVEPIPADEDLTE